jgi:hypothetical protein
MAQPIRLLNTVTKGSNSTFTTTAIDTTGAMLLVAVVSCDHTKSPLTPTDSRSNTWSALTVQTQSTAQSTQIFYVAGPTTDAAHTFTLTGSSLLASIAVLAFSGIAVTSPFDKENGVVGPTSSTTVTCGSITPTQNGELIIAAASSGGAVATTGVVYISATSGSQIAMGPIIPIAAGVSYPNFVAYGTQTTAAAINVVLTFSGTGTNSLATGVVASFKASGDGYLLVN